MRRWATASAIVAALSGPWFVACGSSAETGPPVPVEDLARLLADAICNNIGPCCQASALSHNSVQCHSNAQSGFGIRISQLKQLPNRTYDPAAARACVDAFADAAGNCTRGLGIDAACDRVFPGTLKPGQTCIDHTECVSGSICLHSGDGISMKCFESSQVRGKAGEACRETCTELEGGEVACAGAGTVGTAPVRCFTNDGLQCDRANTCSARRKIGETCVTSYSCEGDAFCDTICVARRNAGFCDPTGDLCAATAYCDRPTQTCQARKARGAACILAEECQLDDWCLNGTCQPHTFATYDTCRGNY